MFYIPLTADCLPHYNARKSDHFQSVLRVYYRKTITNFESLTSLQHGLYNDLYIYSKLTVIQ